MISVQQAEDIILQNMRTFPPVEMPLPEAYGMTLQEDIVADRDYPPAPRATMDGIAVAFKTWRDGQRNFLIAGRQNAGDPLSRFADPQSCFEIMTGAILPEGTDCVIPVEQVTVEGGRASVPAEWAAQERHFVHQTAQDFRQGDVLIRRKTMLTPAAVLTAAAVGKATVRVAGAPKIAVIGTGDELVEIDRPVKPYQFRRSNGCAVQCALAMHGFSRAERFHIRDDLTALKTSLAAILKKFDVLIVSGGVSMGKLDLVPQALDELKVNVLFHKVNQKPGKPFWFGLSPEHKPVFALPGNPVSTLICAYRYVLPALFIASGLPPLPAEYAVIAQKFSIPRNRMTNFIPVTLSYTSKGVCRATPRPLAGSGQFAGLIGADGFAEFPESDRADADAKDAAVRIYRWRLPLPA